MSFQDEDPQDTVCGIEFCVCVPPNNDSSNCDTEFMTGSLSCGETELCYSEWASNISPSILCNSNGNIERFDIIKNPKELGYSNEQTIWSYNSVSDCNQSIPKCQSIDFSPSPTSTPIENEAPTMTPLSSSSFVVKRNVNLIYIVALITLQTARRWIN